MNTSVMWLMVFCILAGYGLRIVHDSGHTIAAVVLGIVAGAIMGMWNTGGERR